MTITEPGIVTDLDERTYHADPVPESSLSVSGAKTILDCPERFQYERANPPVSQAFSFGHAAHSKVLGRGATCVTVPTGLLAKNGAASTTAAKEFIAEQTANGITVIKADEAAAVDAMAAKILEHPIASRLFASGVAEQSMFWRDEDTRVMLRGRSDWINEDVFGRPVVVDYKTTARTADPTRFGWEARDYRYHMQDAWYREGLDTLTGDTHGFIFVVQEKTAPYLVSVVELDDESREEGAHLNRTARAIYLECMTTGQWPGYAPIVHPISIFRRLQGVAA